MSQSFVKQIRSLIVDGAKDLLRLLHFFTRLPLPQVSYKPLAQVLWPLPLAGLILAFCAWVLASVTAWIWPNQPWIVAGLLLSGLTLLTGALHDDALSDTADGLGGGWNKDRKLAIMKDSRIGAYGVGAMILSLGLRWAALSALIATNSLSLAALVWVFLASRSAFMPSMALQATARTDGQAKLAGTLDLGPVGLSLGSALLLGLWLLGPMSVLVFIPAMILAVLAQRQIGGVTGDILGAQIMLTEITALLLILV